MAHTSAYNLTNEKNLTCKAVSKLAYMYNRKHYNTGSNTTLLII